MDPPNQLGSEATFISVVYVYKRLTGAPEPVEMTEEIVGGWP